MTWHARLNDSMIDKGWTKAELSKRSGVSYDNVLKYCRGKVSQPRGAVIDKLAEALDVDSLWLKTGETRQANFMEIPSSGEADEQQTAFNMAVKIADQWEVELFGKSNIVAHTTLVTHLYHYIIKNGIDNVDSVLSNKTFSGTNI